MGRICLLLTNNVLSGKCFSVDFHIETQIQDHSINE